MKRYLDTFNFIGAILFQHVKKIKQSCTYGALFSIKPGQAFTTKAITAGSFANPIVVTRIEETWIWAIN